MWSGISSVGSATNPSGNSGKSRTVGMRGDGTPGRLGRITGDDRHRARLVPARPARPRPPLADRRRELREALRERGADLVVRSGEPARELGALAEETGAGELHFASDVSGFAMARDRRVCAAMDD